MIAASPPTRRRRLARFFLYGTLVGVLGLALLHPYLRQMIFGPSIQGLPFAYWQDQFRLAADPDGARRTATARLMRALGFGPDTNIGDNLSGRPEMAPVLFSLVDDPNHHVRMSLAHALVPLPTSDEKLAALERLLADPHPRVRGHTAVALQDERSGAADLLPTLMAMLDDPDAQCRVHAAWAVLRVTGKKSPEAITRLLAALQDPGVGVRSEAAAALGYAGDAQSFPVLLAWLRHETQPMARHAAVRELGGFGPVAVPALTGYLRDPDSMTRLYAAHALARLGPRARDAVGALEALCNDPDDGVRTAATRALWRIDPETYPRPEEQ